MRWHGPYHDHPTRAAARARSGLTVPLFQVAQSYGLGPPRGSVPVCSRLPARRDHGRPRTSSVATCDRMHSMADHPRSAAHGRKKMSANGDLGSQSHYCPWPLAAFGWAPHAQAHVTSIVIDSQAPCLRRRCRWHGRHLCHGERARVRRTRSQGPTQYHHPGHRPGAGRFNRHGAIYRHLPDRYAGDRRTRRPA